MKKLLLLTTCLLGGLMAVDRSALDGNHSQQICLPSMPRGTHPADTSNLPSGIGNLKETKGECVAAPSVRDHSDRKKRAVPADNLQSLLSFETSSTFARPLMPENLEAAKALDNSDESYVQVMDGVSLESLRVQADFFTCTLGIGELRKKADLFEVYYGIFEKTEGSLIGVFKITRWNTGSYDGDKNLFASSKNFLSTDVKFHKNHQGKGYATEFKQGLFEFYQKIGLIPNSKNDSETPYMGFSGLIHLHNKPSLAYNVKKCGYKVGRLFGDRVEVYYPFVVKTCDYGFLPPEDESLHDKIAKSLLDYLSRDNLSGANEAEKFLRRTALENLLSCDEGNLKKALASEYIFLATTLDKFPDMWSLILPLHKAMVKEIFSKKLAKLEDYISKHPSDAEKYAEEYSDYLRKLKAVIK